MADGMNGPGYSVTPAPTAGRDDPKEGPKRGQRDGVIEAVLNAGLSFWRDLDGVAYATVPAQDGCGPQRHRVQSRRFALLVRDLYGQANLRTVGSQGLVIPGSVSDTAMKEVSTALEAIALRGAEREAEVRVCRWQGAVWLDLGGPTWRLVRVDAAGWRVMDSGDPPLIRPEGLRALPIPKTGHRVRQGAGQLTRVAERGTGPARGFHAAGGVASGGAAPDRPLFSAGAGWRAGQRQVNGVPRATAIDRPVQGRPSSAAPQRR